MGAWCKSWAAMGRDLARDLRGGIAVIGALSLSVMIGMGAFAVEATQGYAAKASNQRIADMAALAGALAYNVNNSTSEMTATARAVVKAQGLQTSDAVVVLTTDAATARQLVQVTVTTTVPLSLGRVFSAAPSYQVSAISSATTTTTATVTPPCIAALSGAPAYGVNLSGGVSISAPGCAINTNAGVTVPWGITITAKQVNAGKSVSNPGSGITTAPTANNIVQNKANAAIDWMKDDAGLKAMLCAVNKLTGTSDADYADGNTACVSPLVTPATAIGAAWNLNYSPAANVAPYRVGTSANYVIPPGSYDMTSLTLAGGITATFQGPVNLTIGTIGMGGTALHVGSGNISIGGRIDVTGGALVDFDVGVGNSVTIGSTGGVAINVSGGSRFCFTANCVAPTAAGGTFSVGGDIISAGGTQIVFPKAATHIINGNLSLNGGSTLGAGTYIIRGNFTNNTGGTMAGTDISFALGGTFTLAGGTSLDLAAPNSLASYGVPGILIATKSASGTTIGGGSANRYAGLLYAPKSDLSLSGGASMSANASNCLMMILSTLTQSGGGQLSTGSCSSLSTTGSTPSVGLFR